MHQEIDKINNMISMLYDDDREISERLYDFYRELYEIIYYDRVSIMFYKKAENGWYKHSSVSLNWDDIAATMTRYAEYLINIDDTIPILSQNKPIVFRCSQIFDCSKREDTKYFREFIKPSKTVYSIEANLDLKSNIGMYAAFYMFREPEKQDFSVEEENIIRLFQPHLSRILTRYGESKNPGDSNFILDSFSCAATIMLDNKFNAIRCSNAYRKMRENFGSQLDERIVDCCISMKKKMDGSVSDGGSFEMKIDNMPYYVEIVRNADPCDSNKYSYICIIFDVSKVFSRTVEKVKEKYGLTEREFNVFELLLKGKDTKEIAGELFISVPAVKKYCSAIYDKMDITSRNQILTRMDFI